MIPGRKGQCQGVELSSGTAGGSCDMYCCHLTRLPFATSSFCFLLLSAAGDSVFKPSHRSRLNLLAPLLFFSHTTCHQWVVDWAPNGRQWKMVQQPRSLKSIESSFFSNWQLNLCLQNSVAPLFYSKSKRSSENRQLWLMQLNDSCLTHTCSSRRNLRGVVIFQAWSPPPCSSASCCSSTPSSGSAWCRRHNGTEAAPISAARLSDRCVFVDWIDELRPTETVSPSRKQRKTRPRLHPRSSVWGSTTVGFLEREGAKEQHLCYCGDEASKVTSLWRKTSAKRIQRLQTRDVSLSRSTTTSTLMRTHLSGQFVLLYCLFVFCVYLFSCNRSTTEGLSVGGGRGGAEPESPLVSLTNRPHAHKSEWQFLCFIPDFPIFACRALLFCTTFPLLIFKLRPPDGFISFYSSFYPRPLTLTGSLQGPVSFIWFILQYY